MNIQIMVFAALGAALLACDGSGGKNPEGSEGAASNGDDAEESAQEDSQQDEESGDGEEGDGEDSEDESGTESGESNEDEGSDESDASGKDSEGESEGDSSTTEAEDPWRLSGTIVDEAGEPVLGAAVLLCGPKPPLGGCEYYTTKDDGEWNFEFHIPGTFKISVNPGVGIDETRDFSIVAFQVHMELGDEQHIDEPIVFPETGARQLVADGPDLDVGDGLSFVVDAESFELPFGNDAEPYMAANLLDDEQWKFLGIEESLDEGKVAAMWALNPYEAKSEEAPIGIRIANDYGFEPGAEVAIYEVDHEVGVLIEVDAGATVSEDGSTIESAEGKGLHHVSWLAIVEK